MKLRAGNLIQNQRQQIKHLGDHPSRKRQTPDDMASYTYSCLQSHVNIDFCRFRDGVTGLAIGGFHDLGGDGAFLSLATFALASGLVKTYTSKIAELILVKYLLKC